MNKECLNKIVNNLKKEDNIKKYRPIPFWSWNDKLEEQELRRQVRWMKEQGFGGYFMHARSGLITEYLSDEWFNCIKACVDEGEKIGIDSWAYDENGWPSGFVGGKLLEEEDNRDKFLTYKIGAFDKNAMVSYRINEKDLTRVFVDGEGEYLNVYENTSISTVDVLNPKVVDKFISLTHVKYKQEVGKEFKFGLKGFFTDEPQYYRYQQPYTNLVKDYFANVYNVDILDGLGLLFLEKSGYKEFRYRYWKAMQYLMLTNYSQKIYDWCEENDYEFTGHYIEERFLETQMMCCAGVMPFYEYETMPGIDHLGRGITSPAKPKQVSSVASELGKKQVLTETYAGCGWDVFPNTLKRIAEWQYVNGVNVMCHHLLPYSERGNRKRDYPAHYSWVNPWVRKNIRDFNDYFARLGYLLGESEEIVNVAIFCPIRSVYFEYKRETMDDGSSINASYQKLTEQLSAMNVPYHILDETIMQKHSQVCEGKLIVGKKTYDYIIFPEVITLDKETAKIFEQFYAQGGKMLFVDKIPSYLEGQMHEYSFNTNTSFDQIINAQEYCIDDLTTEVQSTQRVIDGQKFIFAVNLSSQKQYTVTFNGNFDSFIRLDLETFDTTKVSNKICLDAGESCVLFFEKGEVEYKDKPLIKNLEGGYEVISDSGNYLTLDKLQYSYDGIEFSSKIHHLGLFNKLLKERYNGEIYLKYTFDIDELPNELFFLAEDMNTEWCKINGRIVDFNGFSDFDKGVYKANIVNLVKKGENHAIIKINYYQSEDVYFALFDEKSTESLVNKLVYNTNIEACYLQGNFGVFTRGNLLKGQDKGVWLGNDFYIGKKKNIVTDLVVDGYPFFAGEITLKKEFDYTCGDCVLRIDGNYGYAEVFVNGKKAYKSYFNNYVDVTPFVKRGKNELIITLYTGNRNLLGPHHGVDENCSWVGPGTFDLSSNCDDNSLYTFAERTIL